MSYELHFEAVLAEEAELLGDDQRVAQVMAMKPSASSVCSGFHLVLGHGFERAQR